MSAVQLIVALVLLAVGSAFLFRWLQSRHEVEWQEGVKSTTADPDAQRHHSGNGKHQRPSTRGSAAAAAGDSLSDEAEDEYDDDADGGTRVEADGRVRQPGQLHRNAGRGGLRRRGPQRGHAAEDHHGAELNNDDDDAYDEHGVKLTRLQRKKREKEREKEERRQAQEAALEAQRVRSDDATLKEAEAAVKEEEWKRAEEKALHELRAEKERNDNEEYAKWVGHIGVEERGELGDETRERQARVQAFLRDRAAAVRARAQRSTAPTSTSSTATAAPVAQATEADSSEGNVLVLQSTARDLRVSVEELVNTIEHMTREGEVDGVFDDRGKYVFIAPEHFPQLAQFLRMRGRVSVHEFSRECNRIIMQT